MKHPGAVVAIALGCLFSFTFAISACSVRQDIRANVTQTATTARGEVVLAMPTLAPGATAENPPSANPQNVADPQATVVAHNAAQAQATTQAAQTV